MKAYRHLYGPVPSRRLGQSLGIDLVPHKVCTYDCIYCQIGKTTEKTLQRKEYVPEKEVLQELRAFLNEAGSSVDYLSLGGSGEPTLHSKIRSIIKGIKEITPIPVAVITNGSLLWKKKVREDLLQADVILPSLDAVSQEIFEKINRPSPRLSVERVIEGLIEFRKVYKGQIWLEILLCKEVNDTPEELRKMKEVVEQVQPDLIHLNTVVRPPSEDWVKPLSQEEMENIRGFFGERASVISEFDRHLPPILGNELAEEILRILRRRPLSLTDLSKGMGISEKELKKHIEPLVKEGKIKVRLFAGSTFYEI